MVVDASALGGQAGISDKIDNYPGFPDGISGAELAGRFVAQARRYGVELLSAVSVAAVQRDGEDLVCSLSSGQQLASHAVIVATGSTYRRLDVPGEDELVGAGPGGFLVTGPTMETSMPGVFAAGDVPAGSTKQLGSAVGDG